MARQVGRLSAREVANAKPEAGRKRAQLFADGGNLFLQCTRGTDGTISRSWIFKFELDGRRREMGLGPLHTLGLADARERAKGLRLQLLDGKDPIEARLAQRDAQRAEQSERITFKEAAEQFLAAHESGWRNAKHRSQWRNTLRDYAQPLMSRPVKAIDPAVINDALTSLWQRVPETAKRVKWRVERVVQWVKDGKPMPTAAASKRTKHHAALPYAEMPAFMAELRERKSLSARALEFTILCSARTGEVINAKWSEIDLGAKVWVIPASRMKSHREHRVALSARAIEVLKGLEHHGPYVFGGKRSISHMTMLKLLRGMRPGLTVHGTARAGFKTWASETTAYPREVTEAALGHKVGDKLEQAYQRGDLFAKRAKLMEAWAAYCSKPLPAGATVTPLRAGAHA